MNRQRLNRLLRVRTLQLDMVRAEESQAAAQLAQEQALRERIDQLAADAAPSARAEAGFALSMRAAAHYRERLRATAQAAAQRVDHAERVLDHAKSKTQAAKRDESAMEKLLERANKDAVRRAMRALESLGEQPARKRHDIC